jgi:D-amino-acid oxidase
LISKHQSLPIIFTVNKPNSMNRRNFLQAASLSAAGITTGLTSCKSPRSGYIDKHFNISSGIHKIPKLRLSMDRIVKETVGLRPFRPSGPRLDTEMLGNKTIVHNYGHGGSGWSLSWGTGCIAREKAEATGEKKFAVLGCGTVGIATARLLQERGYEVTIYAKDVPPHVTSFLATGTWSPAYRLCDPDKITPELKARWEKACMFSFRTFQNLLGFNDIVSWVDEYVVLKEQPAGNMFAGELEIKGLLPERVMLSRKEHPFNAGYVSRMSSMMFNIPSYLHKQLSDFLLFGGKLQIREFKRLEDIDALEEKCIVNCTGLGAKHLFNDEELTPVSGQLSCLIPQPEVTYKLNTRGASAIARKDGIYLGGNGIIGNWDTTPSREQTERVVHALQEIMQEMRG